MTSHRVAWLLALAFVPACAGGGSQVAPASSSSEPTASSTARSTVASVSTVVPPTTVRPDDPSESASIVDWLEEQRSLGRTETINDPAWAAQDAVIVTAFTQTPTIQGDLVVALADGRIAPVPPEVRDLLPSPPTGMPDVRLSRVGGDPLLVYVAHDTGTIVASRLDPATLVWHEIDGLRPLAAGERLDLYTAGDHALVVHWDNSVTDAYRQWGEVLDPDGTVTAMAAPPADTPIWFTNDAGGRAFLLGLDTVAGGQPDLRSPVAFDPQANEWLTVPTPGWVTCGDEPAGCVWSARHEWPDRQFFVSTPDGVVATLPDGTYGVLDPTGLTWRRLDDPPIALPGPIVASVGDGRLLALPGPEYDGTQALGVAAWLDVAAGTWSTEQIVAPPAGTAPPVWWEPRWWGDVMLLGFDADEIGNPPTVAIDLGTGEVRPPTDEELAAWPGLAYQVPVDDLIVAWRLRAGAA